MFYIGMSPAAPLKCHDNAVLRLYPQTTIIAVQFEGGVVLGADSRTSTGQF